MKSTIEHKGYTGSVEYSAEDDIFHGKVLFINDLVLFEGASVAALKKDFREAVDDYIESCRAEGAEPAKPFKGSFNVRVEPQVHQKLAAYAVRGGKTLNAFVSDILKKAVC